MCGIVGYLGDKDVDSVILVGLEKLEYRGYDSAGIAAIHNGELFVRKRAGRLKYLYSLMNGQAIDGDIGIGHTRWATHGEPTDRNAHPHIDCKGEIAVSHNGIIENFAELREQLEREGHIFRSDTDSEVIVHLVEKFYDDSLLEATLKAIKLLKGSFAIVVISSKEPDHLIGVRKDSPLVVGVGKGEMLLSSDITPLLSHTKEVIIMEDGEIASLRKDSYEILDFKGNRKEKESKVIEWEADMLEIGDYPHFMLKEIHEQRECVEKNISRYLRDNEFSLLKDTNLRRMIISKERVFIQACGTSLHAGMIGKYLLERMARINAEVDFSSEFRYRDPVIDSKTLVIAVSQSGETADTLAGVRMAKDSGLEVLSLVNVVDSSIARESDYVLYLYAGPEVGVASTKAYTSQILLFTLLAIELASLKGLIQDEEMKIVADAFRELPQKIEKTLEVEDQIKQVARRYFHYNNFFFLGRGINYPTALEGALKLKEISYIHAIGYAAGEMKHGPIALVDENLPIVVINPRGSVYEKTLSNTMEVRARGGKILSIVTDGDEKAEGISDETIHIPDIHEVLSPIISVIPLQLLAYHIAVLRGCDVDKPRNLAKSVTVE